MSHSKERKLPAGHLDSNLRKRARSNTQEEEMSDEASQMDQSTWNDHLIEVARTRYRDYLISIYAETTYGGKDSNRRYYFEPLVIFNPSSVVWESHGILKQNFVRFSIQMWNAELHSKVLDCLSNTFVGVREENVNVMPYEEVQLGFSKVNPLQSFRVMNEPVLYVRQNEALDFYFLCDLPEAAETLADDFRHNPEFSLRNFPLKLNCKGLALRNATDMDRPSFSFNVSTFPNEAVDPSSLRIKSAENSGESSPNVVPLFSALKCINPEAEEGQSFGYSMLEFETKSEHGTFDLSTGSFTVKTAGIYQFNFSGFVKTDKDNQTHCFAIKVGEAVKSCFYAHSASVKQEFQTVSLSALFPLKVGERVSVDLSEGKLYQNEPDFVTRFYGILLVEK